VATVDAPGPWALPHCQHWMPNRVDKNRAGVDGIEDRWMPACMHARPPARLGRAPPPRRPAVCMSSDGRVSNTRAAAAPSSPTPTDALSPHRTSPSESGRCARTMDCTDNDDVPTDNDERSAALCPCMPTAPSRDRSIERSSRLSVNQST